VWESMWESMGKNVDTCCTAASCCDGWSGVSSHPVSWRQRMLGAGQGARGSGVGEAVHLLWAGHAMHVLRGHSHQQAWATLPLSAAPHWPATLPLLAVCPGSWASAGSSGGCWGWQVRGPGGVRRRDGGRSDACVITEVLYCHVCVRQWCGLRPFTKWCCLQIGTAWFQVVPSCSKPLAPGSNDLRAILCWRPGSFCFRTVGQQWPATPSCTPRVPLVVQGH
jgi:hypothetical protein